MICKTGQQSRLHDDRLQRQAGNLLTKHRTQVAEVTQRSRYAGQTFLAEKFVGVRKILVLGLGHASGARLAAFAGPVNLRGNALTSIYKVYADVIGEMIVFRGVSNNPYTA